MTGKSLPSETVEAIVEQGFVPARAAIDAGDIPCAALGVVDASGASAAIFAGMAALEPQPEPLTRTHYFDLASLTKVIATTTMILQLAEKGRLDLDRPLTDAIPDLRQYDVTFAPERQITFRDCLTHSTFLPAVEPIYTYGDDPARLRAFVLQREWAHGGPVYSDINFILLGIAIERLTGKALSAYSASDILGEQLCYGPPPGPAVATEFCTWRGRILRGEVHDENCAALGGETGHAGLFGTVDGVLGFARRLMAGELLSPPMMDEIRKAHARSRTCGWEKAYGGWSGGELCSRETIGHTGFTGTGLWIDFERGLGWCLLTNRVHPSRHVPNPMPALRPAVSDALIAAWDSRR